MGWDWWAWVIELGLAWSLFVIVAGFLGWLPL